MTETKTVKIIADSTCDLSKELLTRYDISVLPLHILLGEQECEDGINVTPDEIYQWSDANKTTPKTSAPSMERAMELIRPYTDAGREVICFSTVSYTHLDVYKRQDIWKKRRLLNFRHICR